MCLGTGKYLFVLGVYRGALRRNGFLNTKATGSGALLTIRSHEVKGMTQLATAGVQRDQEINTLHVISSVHDGFASIP